MGLVQPERRGTGSGRRVPRHGCRCRGAAGLAALVPGLALGHRLRLPFLRAGATALPTSPAPFHPAPCRGVRWSALGALAALMQRATSSLCSNGEGSAGHAVRSIARAPRPGTASREVATERVWEGRRSCEPLAVLGQLSPCSSCVSGTGAHRGHLVCNVLGSLQTAPAGALLGRSALSHRSRTCCFAGARPPGPSCSIQLHRSFFSPAGKCQPKQAAACQEIFNPFYSHPLKEHHVSLGKLFPYPAARPLSYTREAADSKGVPSPKPGHSGTAPGAGWKIPIPIPCTDPDGRQLGIEGPVTQASADPEGRRPGRAVDATEGAWSSGYTHPLAAGWSSPANCTREAWRQRPLGTWP